MTTLPAGELRDLVERGYRFAMSLTHDPMRAEDLLQDAWFSILKARGSWNRGYLFATIRNRFVDQCRRNNVVVFEPLVEDEPEPDGDAVGSVFDESEGSGATPLSSALGRLRPEERAALCLSVVEGFSAREIGELLDWPRGTVLSLIHRARAKLQRMLQGSEVPQR